MLAKMCQSQDGSENLCKQQLFMHQAFPLNDIIVENSALIQKARFFQWLSYFSILSYSS